MVDPQRPAYFDHNATTPVHPEVLEAMLPYFCERFGNPSSQHAYGVEARAAVERAREAVASAIAASADEIVFTSGGTEANNLAIFGTSAARPDRHHVVTSAVEHPAIQAPLARLERERAKVDRLGVDARGRVRAEDARAVMTESTLLITVMHANNETGAVQPIKELSSMAHDVGAAAHTDAAQSMGKISVHVGELGVDLLTIAGHKLYAPKGVGALFVKKGSLIAPLLVGAAHERGLRPGTENVPLIVGLGRACVIAVRDLESERRRLCGLAELLWARLASAIPGIALNGPALGDTARLPNTVSVRFPGVSGATVLAGAPEVAASTGAACHQGDETASRGIVALGIPETEALGTVRLTMGRSTDAKSVERAAAALARSMRSLADASRWDRPSFPFE